METEILLFPRDILLLKVILSDCGSLLSVECIMVLQTAFLLRYFSYPKCYYEKHGDFKPNAQYIDIRGVDLVHIE